MNDQTPRTLFSRTAFTKAIGLSIAVLLVLAISPQTQAEETTTQLRNAVAKMNDWLGFGANARGWREYLDLNLLDSLSARGEQADPAKLRHVLDRFEGGPASVQHRIFKDVQDSIEAQVEQIERVRIYDQSDLQFAIRQALANFHKPEISELESQRDQLRKELKHLKEFYRRDYGIRERAKVFYTLQLDQADEFLAELEIEMPPEISVGKISSMIADEVERLEEVTDEIDAMPLAPPREDTDEDESDDEDSGEDEDDKDAEDEDDDLLALPGPDTDATDDLEELEAKQEAIEERITELKKKRADIFKEDKSRQLRRRDIGRELRRLQTRFRELARDHASAAFVSAKRNADRFADSYVFATEDNIQEEYLEQVNRLADLLPELENPQARVAHAKVGAILNWLQNRQQLNDLCVTIRRRYSSPNAYVSASSRLIQGLTTRSTSDCDRLAEDFLGRFARGLSRTDTTVNLATVDNPDQIQISILLGGTVSTSTYVRERKFRINSSSAGFVSGQRDLYANLNGLFSSSATTTANMNSSYGGISSSCRLVQQIAQKSFQEEQGRTDAESTRRVKEQLDAQFESQTTSAIEDATEQLESFAAKAQKYTALLPQLYFRSFTGRVEAVAKKDTRFALGATTAPIFQSAGSDVQVKLHESMLSNYLDLVFAGRTFTKSDFENELKSLGVDVELAEPEAEDAEDGDEAEESEEVEDFKITFAKVRPVQLVFDENVLQVQITGSRFEQGDNRIKAGVIAKIRLKVVSRDGKLILEPVAAPEIDLAEDQEPDAESIAFAKILEERLAKAFDEAESLGVELPANLIPDLGDASDPELLRSMQLGLLELRDGWLYLGWNWQGGIVSTPAIFSELVINEYPEVFQLDVSQEPVDISNEEPIIILDPNPPSVEIELP